MTGRAGHIALNGRLAGLKKILRAPASPRL